MGSGFRRNDRGAIIECGAQASGGNCQYEWDSIPDMARVGFPIIEASPDGTFIVTKHDGTGGRVNVQSVKEQLLYEMGDPKAYITPDVVADFSSIQLSAETQDRVRVFGIKGNPSTEFYKVSIAFRMVQGRSTLVYSWPDAYRKAQRPRRSCRETRSFRFEFRCDPRGVRRVNATHGLSQANRRPTLPEVHSDSASADQVGRRRKDLRRRSPLILTGPPAVTGFAGGRPKVEEIMPTSPAHPKTFDRGKGRSL